MQPERWSAVKQLFDGAVDSPPESRGRFLEGACADDVVLRAEVESLLAAYDAAESFLETPAASAFAPAPLAPQRIGPYRVLGEIGQGGMGTVYRAARDDDQFAQVVAIKVIRGGISGDVARRRFRTERQILAALEHPGIARLLDGGTTPDGVPYLVMEYVDGEPIGQYCRGRGLPLRARLELFGAVCDAVEYAHQKLIVHRDLKPENVLVTRDGQPKLLDFGIAKFLADESEDGSRTATAWRAMTPEYASPEQIRGEMISTASDVYSLGVLLYELLADAKPHRAEGRSPQHWMRLVSEIDPPPPSAVAQSHCRAEPSERLRRALRGDLDNIVLKALAKQPEARYPSVAALAQDIGRSLAGYPVLARRPTLFYSASRFVRRNRLAIASGAFIAVTLAASTVFSAREAARANAERRRAEEQEAIAVARLRDVRQLANTMLFDFYDALGQLPGSLQARQLIAARAVDSLDKLAKQAHGDPEVLADLAAGYTKVGSITYGVDETARTHAKAVALNEALVERYPANGRYRRQFAHSLAWYGNALKLKGDLAGELACYRRALAVNESTLARSTSVADRLQLKASIDDLGRALAARKQTGEALLIQQRGLAIARSIADAVPRDLEARRNVIVSLHILGSTLIEAGRPGEAVASYSEALEIATELARRHPGNNNVRRDLWYVNRNLGRARSLLHQHPLALSHLRTSLTLIQELAEADPTDGGHRRGVVVTRMQLGEAQQRAGDVGAAVDNYRLALAAGERLLMDDPRNQETYDDLRELYRLLREVVGTAERARLAESEAALYRAVLARDPRNEKALVALARNASTDRHARDQSTR